MIILSFYSIMFKINLFLLLHIALEQLRNSTLFSNYCTIDKMQKTLYTEQKQNTST